MKAYVIGYAPRKEDYRLIEVRYGSDPSTDSTYANEQIAKAICRKLNLFGVRVGMHRCAFSIEHLPDGEFGIFCASHPRCTQARSSLFSHESQRRS